MKKLLKVFSFCILPIIIMISCIIIGKINERLIAINEGDHRTMAAGVTSIAWTYRGIYAMVLIIAFSFVLYSKTTKTGKILVLLLVLTINLPLMYYMELAIFFPMGLLIIPIANIFAFIPTLLKTDNQQYS